ncbi:MAG: flavin reductase family protein [Armatimonadota bacterium]
MAVEPQQFKEMLRHWASGITVVTVRDEDGHVHGMTASSFTSVSLQPPLVLLCINRGSRTHHLLAERRAFGVHLLSEGMEELSNRCAGLRGEPAHRLDDLPHQSTPTGAPILEGALAWMDCTLWAQYDGGDHTIYIGEIQAGGTREGAPLLWYNRGYRHLADPDDAAR